MFAEICDNIFGHTFSVCVEYLVTFGIIDIVARCSCHYVSQLEVRYEGTGLGVDPSELEEAVCVRC